MTIAAADAGEDRATLFGHPRGIATVAATEVWDRISFHGMQALLVLYMVGALLQRGHVEHVLGFQAVRGAIQWVRGPLSVQGIATQIFGLYIGLVNVTPILGGALGDRVLGRRRAVILGGSLMAAGHFCMAFDQSFFLALALLIAGAGIFRGNLAPQLGEMYARDDRRRAVAFQIYGGAVNLGAFIAPLVTGELQKDWGWHAGFAFAGFGMLAGLLIYLAGQRDLPPERNRSAAAPMPPLNRHEWRVIAVLLALVPVAALFWIAQSQIWNTYNLWARDHVQLQYGSWTMPVPWLQSLDGLAPFGLIPPLLMFWRWQAKRGREPDEIGKMARGCFIFAAGTLVLAVSQFAAGPNGRVMILFPVVFHLVSNVGWIFFAPTATSLFSRAAPAQVNATMIGLYYLSVFLGSTISGSLGALYEKMSPAGFWSLHAGCCALGGVMLVAAGWTIRRSQVFD